MKRATILLVALMLIVSVSAMAGPKDKLHVPPNGENTKGLLDCTNAIPIDCGDSYQGTTVGGDMNVAYYSCNSWNEAGPEVVFELVLPPPSTYSVTASVTPDGCDLDVYFLGSCDEDDCLGYGDSSVTVSDLDPGTYYIVVDSYGSTNTGCPFTLDVACTEIVPPCCPFSVDCCVLDFNIQNCGWWSLPCDGESVWEWGVPVGIPDVACDDVPVTHVLGTVLGGNYAYNSGEIAAVGPINVDEACYCLEICHYYDIESDYTAWDGANVKVSADMGQTWTLVTPADGYDGVAEACGGYGDLKCICGEPVFHGDSVTFVRDCFDLTEFAGQQLLVGFFFGSDGSVNYPGWYIKWVKLGGEVTPVENSTWGSIKAMYR